MADRVDHTHGDTGVKPAQDLNFQDGDYPDPEVFDWFWSEVPAAIEDHADTLEALDSDGDGTVDAADQAGAAAATGELQYNLRDITRIDRLASGTVTLAADEYATVGQIDISSSSDAPVIFGTAMADGTGQKAPTTAIGLPDVSDFSNLAGAVENVGTFVRALSNDSIYLHVINDTSEEATLHYVFWRFDVTNEVFSL